jgi:hypothetical protein
MGNVVGTPHTQSTYIYRVPQCMSTRWNWDSPTPSLASECALPPRTKGWGGHSPAAKGWGSPNSVDWGKSLALCLLCVLIPPAIRPPGLKAAGETAVRGTSRRRLCRGGRPLPLAEPLITTLQAVAEFIDL